MNEKFYTNLKTRLEKEYPIGIPRPEIDKATGNVINKRTIANLDREGKGIPGRFKLKKQVIYPVEGVIQFLQDNIVKL